MASQRVSVIPLVPGVQSYEWGVPGRRSDCLVAHYASATKELHFDRKDDQPYAELWMGTHPTLPSYALLPDGSKVLLHDYLCEHKALVGDEVVARFGLDEGRGALPFLFKVLSINKALSIQAHPDKALAEKLHKEKPAMYKDDNHKPEMALALSDFEGFCGFRPWAEMAHFVATVPELRSVLEADAAWDAVQATSSSALHDVFGILMRASPTVYEPAVDAIAARYRQRTGPVEVTDEVADLVVRLHEQYPRDIGVFCTFFLNIVHLERGQAMFLGANEPHAYLAGHILECMAASDNVVRAGLTPKARDVDVLLSMLTYKSASADEQRLRSPVWDGDAQGHTLLYDPPIPEFTLLFTALRDSQRSEHRAVHGPSIVLVTKGQGELLVGETSIPLDEGRVYFIAAHTPVTWTTQGTLDVARAFVEVA